MTGRLKKVLLFGTVIILLCFSALIISPFGETDKEITLNTDTGMTQAERKRDFNDLCKFIEKNVPFIDEYGELYGFGFKDIKKYYSDKVKDTSNDFEYYALIKGFINNIPSGHMTMGYPDPDFINGLYKFRTNDYPEFNAACEYWENQIRAEAEKYYESDIKFYTFLYANGEYFQSKYYAEINNVSYMDAKIISVNNTPIDEFIKIYPLEYKLQYDHINKKPYRSIFILNDTCGDKCTVELETKSGDILSKELYIGVTGTAAIEYVDYFRSESAADGSSDEFSEDVQSEEIDYNAREIIGKSMYSYKCEQDNFVYVMFNDFLYGGAEFSDLLDNADLPDNIIIDLRNNTGGYEDTAVGIIERLTDRTIEYKNTVYTSNIYSGYKRKFVSGKYLYVGSRDGTVTGKSRKKYNLYVLVSGETLSAADNFTAFIKNNGLGKIIGENNTKGEAYGSADLKVLEKSGLYFYYTDIKWNNNDGTDNSVYGTAPDIYIPFSEESMKLRDNIILDGEAVYTYENRLKWDNVLIETIEIIKQTE